VNERQFDRSMLRLMAITDGIESGIEDLVARAALAVAGGVTSLQIRLKDEPARVIVAVTRSVMERVSVPVLVNDRFDIALAAGAHGVHVGAEDIPAAAIRPLVPRGFIIGASVGCADEVANAVGADYVGIGPVYATHSKRDAGTAIGVEGFMELQRAVGDVPAIAIGGISAANVRDIIASGAAGVAVVNAVFGARDPADAARALYRAIGS
jgi:thiamine-phosphate pyrophosphorylase